MHEEIRRKALEGLDAIKVAILDLLNARSYGLTNNEISEMLSLESDQEGKQKNYLAWSILGILMHEGRVRRENVVRVGEKAKSVVYKLSS